MSDRDRQRDIKEGKKINGREKDRIMNRYVGKEKVIQKNVEEKTQTYRLKYWWRY